MKTNGNGSIVQLERNKPRSRCRIWQLRVSVGRDPKTGKYRTKTRRFRGSYSDAVEAMRLFISELGGVELSNGKTWLFGDYCNHYLALLAQGRTDTKRTVSQSTVNKEKWNLQAVSRLIGNMQLSRIGASDIERVIYDMRNGETSTGKRASGTYLRAIYSSLNKLFSFALKSGDIGYNPAQGVEKPAVDTAEKKALSKAQVVELVARLDAADRYDFAFLLILFCGLRKVEVVNLTWDNVQADTLEIRRSKTRAGIRYVPIVNVLHDAIQTRREALSDELAFYGMEITPDMPLIADETGEGVTSHHLGVVWQKRRLELGLEAFTLHELRHTFASLLSSASVPVKDMQELIGHSDAQTTLDIYAHTNLDSKVLSMNNAFAFVPRTVQQKDKLKDK